MGYNIIGLTSASFDYGETETTTTFVYDSTGARVKKTAGGETAIYLGKDYEVDNVTIKHIFLGDRRITTKKSSGEISYIHDDHISSSNVVTDASGNQSAMYEYDPYGATVTHTGAVDLKHQFTGQEKDDSTGLHYYNARYYDSQLGRFITPDWMVQKPSDPQTLNRYAYARNNPIRFTDPTGNFFIELFVAIVIGAVIGAAVGALDAAFKGDNVLKGAAGGAISGAIGGAIAGVAAPALSSFGEFLGKAISSSAERLFTVGVDVAKVGLSGYHVAQDIKNQNYASLALDTFGVLNGLEDMVGNQTVQNVQEKSLSQGAPLEKENSKNKGNGIFNGGQVSSDTLNPSSSDFKNNLYGQVEAAVFRGDHKGEQKRFWNLHVHDFTKDPITKQFTTFQYHYDAFAAGSPLGAGLLGHGIDARIQQPLEKGLFGLERNIDKSNSVFYNAVNAHRFRSEGN